MRTLTFLMILALVGCTQAQLETAEDVAQGVQVGTTAVATVASNPAVVAATGGTSTLLAELVLALGGLAWATERIFAWRLKLKAAPKKK